MSFIEKWKTGESQVGKFLAETKTGSIVKATAVPVILWIGESSLDWDLPGWVLVALVGAAPAAVNAINPADSRSLVGRKEVA